MIRSRRAVALAAIVVVAGTVAVQPMVLGQPGPLLAALGTTGHLLATAAWLGGLVALAIVVWPGRDADEGGEADGLVTRFSPVATLGLVLLVVASGLTVLAGTSALADERRGRCWWSASGCSRPSSWSPGTPSGYRRLAFRRLFSPLGPPGRLGTGPSSWWSGPSWPSPSAPLSVAVLISLAL